MQAVRDPREPDGPAGGPRVDPTFLAERRARRAELNEAALRERTAEAEQQLATARSQLAAAHDQRAELAAQLKQAERELRASRQGEHAEAARRAELEEDSATLRHRADRQLAALRADLAAEELRVAELEDELGHLLRAAVPARVADRDTPVPAGPEVAGGGDPDADPARRQALEDERERSAAEVLLLQHELDRRADAHAALSDELAELRAELDAVGAGSGTGRPRLAEAVLEELAEVALKLRDELHGLEAERQEIEQRLGVAQAQVADRDARLRRVEDELLRRQAELEDARAAARAGAAELEQGRLRQQAAEQLAVRAEERAQEGESRLEAERRAWAQAESELRLAFAVERAALEDRIEQHRAELEAAVAGEQASFASQLASVREGVLTLRERLVQAEADLESRTKVERAARLAAEDRAGAHEQACRDAESRLAAERAARTRAEDALAAERDRVREREQSVVQLEDELEQTRIALRPSASMPPADHPALTAGVAAGPAATAVPGEDRAAHPVIIDLARAAARLRTRRDDGDDGDAPTPAVAVPSPPDAEAAPAEPTPVVELGPRLPTIGRHRPRSWLTPSLTALGHGDPHAAKAVFAALAPVQAARLREDLTYDLAVGGHPELRVCLRRDGTATVGPRAAEDGEDAADFRLSGSAAALAPYAGGGIGRRTPPGVLVSGRRRRARRLARALRDPVGLHALTAPDVAVPADVLLTLLVAAIDPVLTAGERFTVAFVVGKDPAGPADAHVVVADGRPPGVHTGAPQDATATVHTAAGALAAFLGGEGAARVFGDGAAVGRFLAWADAAQGLDG